MAQKISICGLGATGIVGVLFIMGMVSKALNYSIGDLAIYAAILIGIVLGILGVVGILLRSF